MIITILENDFITIGLILGMLLFLVFIPYVDKRSKFQFLAFLFVMLAINVSEIVDCYLTSFSQPMNLRYLVGGIGYALRPVSVVIVIGVLLRHNRKLILIWIPAMINIAFAIINCFWHIMFKINPKNALIHGPAGYVPHIVSAFYLVMLVMITVKNQKYIDRFETLIVYYLAILCTIAAIIEMRTDTRFVLSGAMMIACTLYYMFFYVQSNKSDPLTGLLNRNTFASDTELLDGQEYALISFDMNCLKDINDSLGHAEGDEALMATASVIISCTDRRTRVYRVGGDEFMAVCRNMSEYETRAMVGSMRRAMSKTKYMCSFGYAMVNQANDFTRACRLADKMMYEDKQRYKHR